MDYDDRLEMMMMIDDDDDGGGSFGRRMSKR